MGDRPSSLLGEEGEEGGGEEAPGQPPRRALAPTPAPRPLRRRRWRTYCGRPAAAYVQYCAHATRLVKTWEKVFAWVAIIGGGIGIFLLSDVVVDLMR